MKNFAGQPGHSDLAGMAWFPPLKTSHELLVLQIQQRWFVSPPKIEIFLWTTLTSDYTKMICPSPLQNWKLLMHKLVIPGSHYPSKIWLVHCFEDILNSSGQCLVLFCFDETRFIEFRFIYLIHHIRFTLFSKKLILFQLKYVNIVWWQM